MRHFLLATTAALALSVPAVGAAYAQAILTGQVTSTEEGAMEGVVVSAKQDGSTIQVSVVTNAQGHYEFPAAKLAPGHYTLAIRAAGYDLDGPGVTDVVTSGPRPPTSSSKRPPISRRS